MTRGIVGDLSQKQQFFKLYIIELPILGGDYNETRGGEMTHGKNQRRKNVEGVQGKAG